MNSFEQDKTNKIKQNFALRVVNLLGMVAWREDRYGCAEQYLRVLHPLSWPLIVGSILYFWVMYGTVDLWKGLKGPFFRDVVWW